MQAKYDFVLKGVELQAGRKAYFFWSFWAVDIQRIRGTRAPCILQACRLIHPFSNYRTWEDARVEGTHAELPSIQWHASLLICAESSAYRARILSHKQTQQSHRLATCINVQSAERVLLKWGAVYMAVPLCTCIGEILGSDLGQEAKIPPVLKLSFNFLVPSRQVPG
jgi:hypothetical protein